MSYHELDNSLTEEDRQYIPQYLIDVVPLPENPVYRDELSFIIAVQRAVLHVAPRNDALSLGQKKEPKELHAAKTGLCFDRSSATEKIFRY